MARIRVLPDLLVNKIAAGEVVERPASVIKELLENAVDAGGLHIQIDVEDGGRKLIRVADDGCGIAAEDLPLAVMPHATSKITCEEDLFAIGTMGFRGEALPSIGAVSYLTIASRRAEDVGGHRIQISGDRIDPITPFGCPPGTTVEVRDLFFNVPARRKFLKTVNTEFGYITEQFARIAVSYPELHLTLTHNGRVLHRLPATESRLARIGSFYGEEVTSSFLPVHRDEQGMQIDGFVVLPSKSRATNQWQYAFVNGRYVRDKFILHAVKEAYRGLIDPHRHPAFFLFIRTAPDAVDVNVHPTKIEVRWRESGLVHSQILSLLRETFLQHDLTPAAVPGETEDEPDEERRSQIRQAMADFFKKQTPAQSALPFSGGSRLHHPSESLPSPGLARREVPSSFEQRRSDLVPWGLEAVPPAALPVDSAARTGPPSQGSDGAPKAKAIQLHNAYLVAETEEGLVIIDQHALHERVLYETFHDRLAQGPLESQRLLIPETLEASAEQMAATETHADLLHDLGIEVGFFGNGLLAVHSFPVLLQDKVDVGAFLRDLLDKLAEAVQQPSREVLIHEILDMMACKAAVKAGDPLTPVEIQALLEYRDRVERSSNCPHGRPTSLRLSLKDLEKQFHRT
jgi:DNA mismatch repair protein MutL